MTQFDLSTHTVQLNSGYAMPTHGIGAYNLLGSTCIQSLHAALDLGVRLIDTANLYRNEREVGQAVRTLSVPREEIFVATKLYPNQYADPEAAIAEALEKLDIGYIDLMLLHHPGRDDVKAYKAMERAVTKDYIRSLGISCFYIQELQDFLPRVDTVPALVQNEIHPYYQDTDVVQYIQGLGLGITVEGWYPLGGRGHQGELLSDPVLTAIAEAHGKSVAQVILRWLLQRHIVVIPGSSNPAHILANTQLYDFSLTDGEMAQIAKLDRREKHDWY